MKHDDMGDPDSIPVTVGSLWRARDGRIMRVMQHLPDPIYPFQRPRVRCYVLNAHEGMRRNTTIGAEFFGGCGKFLQPHEPAQGIEAEGRDAQRLGAEPESGDSHG